jgi:hypothetical protein
MYVLICKYLKFAKTNNQNLQLTNIKIMSYGINNPFGGLIPKINLSGHADGNKVSFYRISPTLEDGAVPNNVKIYAGDAVKLPPMTNVNNPSLNMGTIVPSLTQVLNNPATQKATLPMGIFLGCNYTDLTGKSQYSKYFPGVSAIMPNTPIYAEVNDDPNLIFSVQISNATALDITTNAGKDSVTFRDLPLNRATAGNMIGKNAKLGIGGPAFAAATLTLGYTSNPLEGDVNKGSAYYLDGSTITYLAGDNDNNGDGWDVTILGLDNDELVQRKDPYQIPSNINYTPGVDMPFCRVICTWNKHYIGKKAGFVSTKYV